MASSKIAWIAVVGNTVYNITDVNISRDTGKTNTASFTNFSMIEAGTYLYITTKEKSALKDVNAPFNGFVTKCKGKNGVYDIACEDASGLLKTIKAQAQIESGFTPNIVIRPVRSNKHRNTIKEYLGYIIANGADGLNQANQAISFEDKNNLGNTTKIPYTDIDLPVISINHMSLGGAIRKLLVDVCHLVTWYKYIPGGSNGLAGSITVSYGLYRDRKVVSNDEYIMANEMVDSIEYPLVDCVTVLNTDVTKFATVGDPLSKKCVTYKLDGTYNTQEMEHIAGQILNDRKIKRLQYKVTFPPGTGLTFKEGDYFGGLGDATLGEANMPYKQGTYTPGATIDVWQMRRINVTSSGTDVYVGDTYRTVFDMYSDKLNEVDGLSATTEELTASTTIVIDPPTPVDGT